MPAVATAVGTDRASRYRRAMESLYIRDEHGRTVPMRFSESQELLWRHIAPRLNRRDKLWFIVLKSRQVYSSTFFCALTFIRTLEQAGTHSLVLAQDLFTSHDLFEKCRTFYDHLALPKLRTPRVNELINWICDWGLRTWDGGLLQRRQIPWLAPLRALVDPALERVDVLGGQLAI